MARFFITGSADGLGSRVAQALVKDGHAVVLHARNAQRAKDAAAACPGSEKVLVADLTSVSETKQLAEEVNKLGHFDGIIHNAALFRGDINRTTEGVPALVQTNTVAPYILTALINKPKRLLYVSSGLHSGGNASLHDIAWQARTDRDWTSMQGYSDSKLHMCLLANAVARRWPDVQTNAMDPGWVPTKMGGAGASGDIEAAVKTYVMLVKGETAGSGKYWFKMQETGQKKEAGDVALQDKLLGIYEQVTGIKLPS